MSTPDLSQYYGNLQTGENYTIQAKIVFYVDVGQGSFSALSPSQVAFSGSYSAAGHSGEVTLNLNVTGPNQGTYNLNGRSGSCTFSEDGDTLTVSFGGTSIQIEWWHDGIWIGGSGVPYNIWIGST